MRKGKILLIDDSENDLKVTAELLKKVGYTVIENAGWLGATKTIKALNPDIVLLDVNMPALSGDRLYELIVGHTKERKIPVLLYSSLDEFYLKKLKLLKGISDYIVKGDVFQLYRKISQYIRKEEAFN